MMRWRKYILSKIFCVIIEVCVGSGCFDVHSFFVRHDGVFVSLGNKKSFLPYMPKPRHFSHQSQNGFKRAKFVSYCGKQSQSSQAAKHSIEAG